jgi:hypothetical protein
VAGAALERPLAHRGGDGVGERRIERLALLEGALKLLEDGLRKLLALHGRAEDVAAVHLAAGQGQVARTHRVPVRAPLGGGQVSLLGNSCHLRLGLLLGLRAGEFRWYALRLWRGSRSAYVHVSKISALGFDLRAKRARGLNGEA